MNNPHRCASALTPKLQIFMTTVSDKKMKADFVSKQSQNLSLLKEFKKYKFESEHLKSIFAKNKNYLFADMRKFDTQTAIPQIITKRNWGGGGGQICK
jgi:hypothetical protein